MGDNTQRELGISAAVCPECAVGLRENSRPRRCGWPQICVGVRRGVNRLHSRMADATWLSHRDLAQLVGQCLTQPLGFEIFYGVSDNTWRFWDNEYAEKVIGYAPLDNAEDYR